MQTITTIITSIITFINSTLVPLVFAVAFIVFLFGIFKYFIAGADNAEKRKTGAQFMMYSIIGFVAMMSVWGIVNVVKNTFGLSSNNRPCLPTFGADTGCTPTTGTGTGTGNGPAPTNLLPAQYQSPQPSNSEPTIPDSGGLNGIH